MIADLRYGPDTLPNPSSMRSTFVLLPAAAGLVLACSGDDPGQLPGIPYDSNADGVVDGAAEECPGQTFAMHPDADGDGLGNPDASLITCELFDGWADNGDDCDDGDDGVGTASTWYGDQDGDGFGDPAVTAEGCEPPDGFVANPTDPYPDCAQARVDECGVCGGTGGATWYADVDGDGVGDARTAVDSCDRPEGYVESFGDPEPECPTDDTDECGVCAGPGARTFYADADADGLGDPDAPTIACEVPLGHVANDHDPEPRCRTNDTDECGVCAGDGSDRDCAGVCFGDAYVDVCGECVGGATGREPGSIDDCPALPDLVIDAEYLGAELSIDRMDVGEGDCRVDSGCVDGVGERRVLRFGVRIANVGSGDLALGAPPADGTSAGEWRWDECLGEHSFDGYATYSLHDIESGEPLVGRGARSCATDDGVYDDATTTECGGHDCGDPGISAGCHDTRTPDLECQWLDVTGVEDGVYDLVVTADPTSLFDELDDANNAATIRVRITGDAVILEGDE